MISTLQAAEKLHVTTQSVRDWVAKGQLRGHRLQNGRWAIDEASVDALVSVRQRQGLITDETGPDAESHGHLEHRLEDMFQVLRELQARELVAERLLQAAERERDRFRSEAIAFREASLQLIVASRETDTGVHHLLEALERQRDALSQLLTPGSAEDLAS